MTEHGSGDLIFYRASDGAVRAEVRYENETFWLSQAQMAELFGVDVRTVNEHLKNIYASGELSETATIRNFRMVRTEGSRPVTREIVHHSLDAIISVGYRVNSIQATASGSGRPRPCASSSSRASSSTTSASS